MSLFGKIKTAIKGNPVLKEHEVGKHIASAGPGLLWKIHNGVKKSTQQVTHLREIRIRGVFKGVSVIVDL